MASYDVLRIIARSFQIILQEGGCAAGSYSLRVRLRRTSEVAVPIGCGLPTMRIFLLQLTENDIFCLYKQEDTLALHAAA